MPPATTWEADAASSDAPVNSLDMLFKPELAAKFADCGISLIDSPALRRAVRPCGGHDRVEAVGPEVGVFEIAEDAQVHRHAEQQPALRRLGPHAGGTESWPRVESSTVPPTSSK